MHASLGVLLALVSLAQGVVECETPWYWPVGSHLGPRPILQAYGQYETVADPAGDTLYNAWDVHRGLDIAGNAGEEVLSPIDGTVVEVLNGTPCDPEGTYPNYYGRVILKPDGQDGWHLKVLHLCSIDVWQNKHVAKGEKLGTLVSWDGSGKPSGFEHVHLELVPVGGAWPANTSMGDPLRCLGGAFDTRPPSFREIWNETGNKGRIAFVSDVSLGAPLVFHPPDSLPLDKLDILLRVRDFFTTNEPKLVWMPVFYFEHFPFGPLVFGWKEVLLDFTGPVVAPAEVRVQITRMMTPSYPGKALFQSAIAFTGAIVLADPDPYLEPGFTSGTLRSMGWPHADLYFIATHSEAAAGAWDTASAGPGVYRVEVMAEDASGNFAVEATLVHVDGP